jgi:tRNA 2-(methylsulfanyl)-N6-isopentenyladenosine37 hydroxylase
VVREAVPSITASPLKWRTPERWAKQVLKDPLALLSDHAYLERKAASNALELLNRWPEPGRPPDWVQMISGIARDEAMHLDQVVRQIRRRGGQLSRLHKSTYAQDLRQLVRMGRGKEEIVDRLLICALIEARSEERFVLLSKHCKDPELARFYQRLSLSEAGHHAVYLRMARKVLRPHEVQVRWQELLTAEARIIQRQPTAAGIHSGLRN